MSFKTDARMNFACGNMLNIGFSCLEINAKGEGPPMRFLCLLFLYVVPYFIDITEMPQKYTCKTGGPASFKPVPAC